MSLKSKIAVPFGGYDGEFSREGDKDAMQENVLSCSCNEYARKLFALKSSSSLFVRPTMRFDVGFLRMVT